MQTLRRGANSEGSNINSCKTNGVLRNMGLSPKTENTNDNRYKEPNSEHPNNNHYRADGPGAAAAGAAQGGREDSRTARLEL